MTLWKASELEFFRLVGGEEARRFGSQGEESKDGDDGPNGWLSIEHKERRAMPQWLLHAFEQSDVNYAVEPYRLPLVGLSYHPGRGIPVQRFVAMRTCYWREWFGVV